MRSDALIPPGRAYIERINMEKVRIQKIIADSGRCSRRKAEELISAGVVTVNGRPCSLGDKADPYNDLICVEGEEIAAERAEKRYIMLNKPRGYVTSMADEMGRKVASDLLTDVPERVYRWEGSTATPRVCLFSRTTASSRTTSCTRRSTFPRHTALPSTEW